MGEVSLRPFPLAVPMAGRTSEWTAPCVWDRGSLAPVGPEAAEALAFWGPCGFGPGVTEVTSGDKWPVTTCAPLPVMLVREVGQASL